MLAVMRKLKTSSTLHAQDSQIFFPRRTDTRNKIYHHILAYMFELKEWLSRSLDETMELLHVIV